VKLGNTPVAPRQVETLEHGPAEAPIVSRSDVGFRLAPELPPRVRSFPQLRFMGSKFRLLPWIHTVLSEIEFDSAIDAFSGSGCVSFLLKCMGKQVSSNDFMRFSATIAEATIENPGLQLETDDVECLLSYDRHHPHFIERTFSGVFFSPEDLRFLDRVSWNLRALDDPYKRALALSALIRSCVKRQPRGVFTVAGDPEKYKDGRRDLRLSLREHFLEHVHAYNSAAFDNGRRNSATHGDVFSLNSNGVDLIYLDPPYVPRSDDNCYMKRYHFLEGLSVYWEGLEILEDTRVRKVKKPYTPFSYRRTAHDAFEKLFAGFADATIVLSYSSNGYPDLESLLTLMKRYKKSVDVFSTTHTYHFGTHRAVSRSRVEEYLIVGS